MAQFLDEIKSNFLDKNNKISASRLLWFFRKNPIIKQQLFDLTPNCSGDENFMERIFWIENGLTDYLECANPTCGSKLKNITCWSVSKEPVEWDKSNHRLSCSNECKHALHSFRKFQVQEKRVETWVVKYGVTSSSHLETNLFKINNPMKNSNTVEKVKKTCLEKYGVDNVSKNSKIVDKIKEKANRPSHEQAAINKKREDTCLEKYGVNHVIKSPKIIKLIRSNYNQKYGVDHPSQVSEIFEKMSKRGFSAKDYTFPSGKVVRIRGYEWKALDDLLKIYDESEIEVKTTLIPKIKYTWEDQSVHYYYPDIFIKKENLLIEVKSTYTMQKDFVKNIRKAVATKELGYGFKFMVYE